MLGKILQIKTVAVDYSRDGYYKSEEEDVETLSGYVEKGQSIKAEVIIKAVDAKGVIEFEVK